MLRRQIRHGCPRDVLLPVGVHCHTGATMRLRAVVGLGVASALLAASPVLAAEPGSGKLESTSSTALWSGALARNADAVENVSQQDRFALRVSLPKGVWKRRQGGVQVAIRWAGRLPDSLLTLRVSRRGRLVAESMGLSSTAQSVLIPRARNGRYIVDVGFNPISTRESIRYEGLAQVEFVPTPRPSRLLLPDLVPRGQPHVTFDTPHAPYVEPTPAPGQSCFQTEALEDGARLCLRFDQVLANQGEGPLELRFALPGGSAAQGRGIVQRIYHSRGRFLDRAAGRWEFHHSHNHYHYKGFAISRLWRVGRTGAPIGRRPVRSGRKVSFCVVDTKIDAWAKKGDGPLKYRFPNCLTPTAPNAQRSQLVQGIAPGWADVYDWFLPDQYIEVTGVRNGLYVLETIADPDNTVREANERNNCRSVLIRLSRMRTGLPRARFVRAGPDC